MCPVKFGQGPLETIVGLPRRRPLHQPQEVPGILRHGGLARGGSTREGGGVGWLPHAHGALLRGRRLRRNEMRGHEEVSNTREMRVSRVSPWKAKSWGNLLPTIPEGGPDKQSPPTPLARGCWVLLRATGERARPESAVPLWGVGCRLFHTLQPSQLQLHNTQRLHASKLQTTRRTHGQHHSMRMAMFLTRPQTYYHPPPPGPCQTPLQAPPSPPAPSLLRPSEPPTRSPPKILDGGGEGRGSRNSWGCSRNCHAPRPRILVVGGGYY